MSMSIEEAGRVREGFPRPFPDTPSNVLEQFQMNGKVIVVNGAADGIGLAVATAMAEAHGNVALWYNSNDAAIARAEELAQTHGVKTKAYKVEVSQPATTTPPNHHPNTKHINHNSKFITMFKRLVTVAPRVGLAAPRAFAPLAGLQSVQPTVQRQTPAPAQRRSYHEKVLDHYNNPRNVGSMKKGDQDVGTGLVGAPACGDVMKLQIRVNKESGRIDDVVFKTFGCGSAIASSSYLTELVRGMTLEEAGKVKNTDVAKELCLPPVKLHCSMLAEDAIKSAISDYYTKNPKARSTDLSGTGASMADIPTAGSPAASL